MVCTADPVTVNAFVSNAAGVPDHQWHGHLFDATAATTQLYPSAADSPAGSG